MTASEIFPDLDSASAPAVTAEAADLPWQAKVPQPLTTLGQHLTHQAQRVAGARLPNLPWLQALQPVLERVTAMPSSQERYQRCLAPTRPLPTRATRDLAEGEPIDTWGEPLPSDVQQRLQTVVGPGVTVVRTHTDALADVVARAHVADAVTVGEHIFFREDHFRPQQDTGFALLAHEATHVLQALQPNADWGRATQAGQQVEEAHALRREQNVLQQIREPDHDQRFLAQPAPAWGETAGRLTSNLTATHPSLTQNPPPSQVGMAALRGPGAKVASTSATPPPLRAATDRPLEQALPAATPTPNFEELRRTLYRDLLSQIRADFERGA